MEVQAGMQKGRHTNDTLLTRSEQLVMMIMTA